jgi:hypothetical protein
MSLPTPGAPAEKRQMNSLMGIEKRLETTGMGKTSLKRKLPK